MIAKSFSEQQKMEKQLRVRLGKTFCEKIFHNEAFIRLGMYFCGIDTHYSFSDERFLFLSRM